MWEYLRAYLEREPEESEVLSLYDEVNLFIPACHLHWTLWALIQASSSNIDFDYVDYARRRWEDYIKRKKFIVEYRRRHPLAKNRSSRENTNSTHR